MLEAVPVRRLRELAVDASYRERLGEVAARVAEAIGSSAPPGPPSSPGVVAYICSEFGAHCSLPLYGGGLGVLAGDVLKTASDLSLPMIGVGLLYRQGYFHQRLDTAGWQREYWTGTDYERLPAVRVTGEDGESLRIELPLRGRRVLAQIWRIDFGRTPLFLLDADVPENAPRDRWITARLYIGDPRTRLAQYALLGPGAVRALRAMGIPVELYHLNEGHGSLGVFERLAERIRNGADAEQTLADVRGATVVTTHTPVAAGNETYRRDLVESVLGDLRGEFGLTDETFYGSGRPGDARLEPERLDAGVSITALALRTSRSAIGVSRRHGQVAREMWQPLWPGVPSERIPIGHVTNGVHVGTWMADAMQLLFDRHLGPDWRRRLSDPAFWRRVEAIPDEELWAVRRTLRERLVEYARERSVLDRLDRGEEDAYVEAAARVFDPDHLTIGFARRVATYKRLSLLTRRLDRGLALLSDPARPVQLVLAGKAHPQDQDAKESLRALMAARYAGHAGERIVFLQDYDLHQAPRIVAGVDVWLNLPRPPLEASGTSGMKVALNGGLQLSVLDGWWEEAYEPEFGWAIATPPGDPEAQDEHDADVLFDLLEREVVPLFYERKDDGIPHGWIARMKLSLARLVPRFNAERMLREYGSALYDR